MFGDVDWALGLFGWPHIPKGLIVEGRNDGVLGHGVSDPEVWISSASCKWSKKRSTVHSSTAVDFGHE